ncbi:MAG: amidohydrolase family protein [Gemmataceae bacterium]
MRTSLALLFLAAPAFGQDAALAIKNATVETMTPAGRIEKAVVVIRNGKIEAVGKDVKVPDDARVIDAAGGTVMPGIVEPYFEVAVAAAAAADGGTRTVVIQGRVITLPAAPAPRTTFTRVADNFYPYDAGYKPLPRAGFTHLNLIAPIVGQSAGVRVTPADPDHMLTRPNGVAYVSVTNSSDSLDALRSRLEGVPVREGAGGLGGGGRGPGGGRGGPGGKAAGKAAGPPTQLGPPSTAGMALWADVAAGKAPLFVTAANSATVLHVLKIAEGYKDLKLTFVLPADAVYEAADALRGKKVSVIVRPGIDLVPSNRDRFLATKVLHQAGIDFAYTLAPRAAAGGQDLQALLQGQTPAAAESGVADQDFPLFAVAMQVKGGLPRQVALESLTRRPAAMLGMADTHGTVAAGKAADLLIYTGDPLDPASRLRMTLIEGRTVYEN